MQQCRGCDQHFNPAPRKTWCSDSCRARTQRTAGHPSYQWPKGPRRAISYATCAECQQLFVVRRAARTTDASAHKVCRRTECITARHTKHTHTWATNYQHVPAKPRRGRRYNYTCMQCATEFSGRKGAKFCSRFCSQAHTKATYTTASDKPSRRRTERLRRAEVHPVDRQAVLERDRWTCHLCAEKIIRQLKFPHPRSASLDHLIPLAQHGTHEPANVAAAHLDCNRRKGDRGQSEQLALIG